MNKSLKTFFAAALLFCFVLTGLSAQTVSGKIAAADKYGNVTTDISESAVKSAGLEVGDIVTLKTGSFSGNVPFVTAYADVDRGATLVRLTGGVLQLSVNMGNFAEKNAAPAGTAVQVTLAQKGAYKSQLEVRSLVRTDNRADYSSDAVFANFRNSALGGIPAGVLYRSAHPALGDARAPFAARLGFEANIVTIINLADTPAELAEHAATSSWYKRFVDHGTLVSLGMGVDATSPEFIGKLKTGLQFMLNHEWPYLVHCNEGKDRAGVVVALLEGLMGAKVNEIVDDYMQSYVNYYHFQKSEPRYALVSQIIIALMTEMNGGVPLTDATVQQATEKFLTGTVGLSQAEIAKLKVKLSGK
jgi:hypothetical protein